MRRSTVCLVCFSTVLALTGLAAFGQGRDESGFRSLFDGRSLNGWVQEGGVAKYEVVNGTIVGTSVPDTPNSFLCTDREYGDFELELEFKVDPDLNSGIQIRSQVFDEARTVELTRLDGSTYETTIPEGRVHGYQVEIDPSDRGWSGGIYDEGRRGWLNDLAGNRAARFAFRQNEWNHYRIQAIGDSIKTWINGVPAADLVDSSRSRGRSRA